MLFFDVLYILIATVICPVIIGKLAGVREGSVIAALLVGNIIKVYNKEIPHNARGASAGEFQPSAVCKNLDYRPGSLRFLQFASD